MPAVKNQSEQPTAPDTPGARQVQRMKDLEKQRGTILEEIASNRTYLRLMSDNGELTDDEKAEVEVFYPSKERGERRSKDQIAATRAARDAARGKKQQAAATTDGEQPAAA